MTTTALRVLVFDTTSTIPPAASPNVQPGGSVAAQRYTTHLKRKAKRDLRKIGWGMVKAHAHEVHLERARITVTLKVCRHGEQRLTKKYPAYRPTDVDNLLASLKGLFDGFVDARLIPDDDAAHLVQGEHGFEEHGFEEVSTPFLEGLRVTIEELEAVG